MAAPFILRKATHGQFHFNLPAANNKNILSSETYRDKSGALAGIESVKANSAADAHCECRTSAKGQAYFVLLAANKEVIGRSEMYSSKSSMERGLASVKRNGRKAASATRPDRHAKRRAASGPSLAKQPNRTPAASGPAPDQAGVPMPLHLTGFPLARMSRGAIGCRPARHAPPSASTGRISNAQPATPLPTPGRRHAA
jgi:uncharacterized protein YegP (UPF0339 family)